MRIRITGCNYYALIQGYCALVSITSLAAISLERHGAIAAPNSFWVTMNSRKKSLVILFLWIYSFIVSETWINHRKI